MGKLPCYIKFLKVNDGLCIVTEKIVFHIDKSHPLFMLTIFKVLLKQVLWRITRI